MAQIVKTRGRARRLEFDRNLPVVRFSWRWRPSSSVARVLRGVTKERVLEEVGSTVADIVRELPPWNVEDWRASSVTVFAKATTQESDDEV